MKDLNDLKKELTDLIDKHLSPVNDFAPLVPGKWYVLIDKPRKGLPDDDPTFMYNYREGCCNSFGIGHYWIDGADMGATTEGWRPATHSEILEALSKEATKRGIISGAKVKRPLEWNFCSGEITLYGSAFLYEQETDSLYVGGFKVYYKGQWAEVVKSIEVAGFSCERNGSNILIEGVPFTSTELETLQALGRKSDKHLTAKDIETILNHFAK